MLDFSNAPDQTERNYGPVPGGSIVLLQMTALHPDASRQDHGDPYIAVAKGGLKQLYCQFDVIRGRYNGVSFRQNITLPAGMQSIPISGTYEQACNIGAATLKAICIAAGVNPRMPSFASFTGLKFPARLRIAKKSRANGDYTREFWNNEISRVITPDMAEYNIIRQKGEIIEEKGPVTGQISALEEYRQKQQVYSQQGQQWDAPADGGGDIFSVSAPGYHNGDVDEVPFG